MDNGIDVQERAAKAAEYSAYQLSQINEKLDKLFEKVAGLLG
jgi:hypothetical protein